MNLPFISTKYKLSQSEKLAIVESLSIMLSAGIPIIEALESIAEDMVDKNAKLIVVGVSQEISGGKSLFDALNSFPESFDPVLTNIIKSGEASGKLDKVLAKVTENFKSSIETSDNIKSALFYPVLVLVTLTAVSIYMFAFALPRIANVFTDLAIELPAYSAFIIKSSLFFQKYFIYIISIFIVLILVSIRLLAVTKIRRVLFTLLTKVPSFHSLFKLLDLSRFTSTTALLLNAGLPIIDALDISKNVVISPKFKGDIEFLKESITQGTSLSEGMKVRTKSFPSLLRRIISVGEETGNLGKSLADISSHYEKKFTNIIRNLTVLLEPILMVLIGILVGVVLLSIIAPIYQLIGQINPE
ncbi:type II secretion system F family protein [Patescibacteria group bacterium]|nr:type II secretion system F family protein [Patescibacteria group bacterium]